MEEKEIILKIEKAISKMFELNLTPSSIHLPKEEYEIMIKNMEKVLADYYSEPYLGDSVYDWKYKGIDVFCLINDFFLENENLYPSGFISTSTIYKPELNIIEYARHFHLEPFKEIL